MKCVFCGIIKGEIDSFKVWENKDFIILLDINPVAKGHIMLIPKKHIDYLFSINNPLYGKIFNKAKEAAEILKRKTKAARIGLVVEGFAVSHVHVHLVPINKPGDLDPSKAKRAPYEELQKMQKEFEKYFKKMKQ